MTLRIPLMTLLSTLLWMLIPPQPAWGQGGARHVLILSHDDGGPGTERLAFTRADAERVAEVMIELGGVLPKDLQHLDRPTPSQVLDALEDLGAHVASSPSAAQLVVYYSGHADASALRLGDDRLELAAFEAAIAKTGAGVRLIVLDACASGALTVAKGGTRVPSFLVRVDDAPGISGQVILASSAADEASQESRRIGGGIFTHHLVTGMRGAADQDRDGAVTLDEAYGYAYHQTLYDTAVSLGGVQHPTYRYDLSGRGELILTRAASEATAILFPEGSDGTYLIFNRAQRTFIGEIRMSGGARRLDLPPGSYLVQKRAGDHLLAAEVTLSRGASARLEEGDMEHRALEDDFTKGVIRANQLRAQGPQNSLQISVGAQGFFNTPVRESLVPQAPLVGLSYAHRGWPAPTLATRIELSLGGVETVLAIEGSDIPVDFDEVQLGVGVLKLIPLGPVTAHAGVHLVGLYLRRAFLPPLEQPAQTFVNLTPGVSLGVDIPLGRRAGLSLEGRSHYLFYYADDNLSLGFGELRLGTFVRF